MKARAKHTALKKPRVVTHATPRSRRKVDTLSVSDEQMEKELKKLHEGILNAPPYTPMSEEERRIRRAHQTPYDRIKHLSGIITDLPADLLTNPKYMEDFGK
jgi:hypothetical protein